MRYNFFQLENSGPSVNLWGITYEVDSYGIVKVSVGIDCSPLTSHGFVQIPESKPVVYTPTEPEAEDDSVKTKKRSK